MTKRMKMQEPKAAREIAVGYDKVVKTELTETEEVVYNAFYTVLFIDVNHVPEASDATALQKLAEAYDNADNAVGALHSGNYLRALRLAQLVSSFLDQFSQLIELVEFPCRVTLPQWETENG